DVGAQLAPGEVRGVALGERTDLLAVDDDVVVVEVDGLAEAAQHRVVLEQVGQGLVVGQVVDANDLDVRTRLHESPVEVPADTAEAVDADADGHNALLRGRRPSRRTRFLVSVATAVDARRRVTFARVSGHRDHATTRPGNTMVTASSPDDFEPIPDPHLTVTRAGQCETAGSVRSHKSDAAGQHSTG